MAVQLERRRFTLDEYERMIESGVFGEDERIELIRGELVNMAPIGLPHEVCVTRLTTLLVQKTAGGAIVWPQNNSIRLPGSNSRPEPDVTLLKWRDDYYSNNRPTPQDVLLVVEVAETSVQRDRNVKGPLYAGAGIPEYWIVDLKAGVVEVYKEPIQGQYKQTRKAKRGDALPLPAEIGSEVLVSRRSALSTLEP